MLLYICCYPGCGRTMEHRGYCDLHKDKKPVRSFGHPTTARYTLYNTTRWRELRRKILERDGNVCRRCGASVSRLQVDHIVNHNGNEDLFYDENNLQVLCPTCHAEKCYRESSEKASKRRG